MKEPNGKLRDLVESGLPEHPYPDFAERLDRLTEIAIRAREQKRQRDEELLHAAADYLERLEGEIETVAEQLRRLAALRDELDALGPDGAEGAQTARQLASVLKEHHSLLKGQLDEPSLQKAKERRREWRREKIDEIRSVLESELQPSDAEGIVSDLLQLASGDGWNTSMELTECLERKVREGLGVEKLRPVQRFWHQMRKRVGDPELREKATVQARRIREELSAWEESRDAHRAVRRLCDEVHTGLAHIDGLGSEEQTVQLHVWLGKMRHYQDGFELDQEAEHRLHRTFGAIDHFQKEARLKHYFDALDRRFSTDWDVYVRSWTDKLEEARRQDERDREARSEQEALQAEQLRKVEEANKKKAERLGAVLEALNDPLDDSEVRDLLELGVESDGCLDDDFLKAAASHARLAYGTAFRRLRRSLKRLGVDESELGTAEPPLVDPYQQAYARLRAHYADTRVLIVGGLPVESRRRQLEAGIGLSELRWYAHHRGTMEHREAEAAIRSGEYQLAIFLVRFSSHKVNDLFDLCRKQGIPAEKVDRGCGVTALLRAFQSRIPSPGARA